MFELNCLPSPQKREENLKKDYKIFANEVYFSIGMIFYHFRKPRCFQISKTSFRASSPRIPYLGSQECLQNQAHVQKQVTNCWAFFYPEMAEDNKIEATVSCPTDTTHTHIAITTSMSKIS
jgi:hypothetical protein